MTFLNPEVVRKVMDQAKADGKFFTVGFIKANGDIRAMRARRGVVKHLKGGKSTIKDYDNLISVFDTDKQAYRCFDANRALYIKMRGLTLEAQ